MMPAPILAGVVYVHTVPALYEVASGAGIRLLFVESYFVELPTGDMTDLHVVAGLKPFANAVKLCVIGEPVADPNRLSIQLKMNRKEIATAIVRAWKSEPGQAPAVRLLAGFVNGDAPPLEALVELKKALESRPDLPVITKRYSKNERME